MHPWLVALVCCAVCFGQNSRDLGRAPRAFAVVIGIGKYKNLEGNDLKYAESDAQALYRQLISKEGGAFAAEDIRLLIGSHATRANIREALERWLPDVAQEDDRVIVYFAGHGVVVGERGYFAPWDVDIANIPETSYAMGQASLVLSKKVRARWKAFFADACHSGRINSETSDEQVSARLRSDFDSTEFLSFAATIGREKSFEDPELAGGFGIFSYFLVEGLKGQADRPPCDGKVTAGELVEYVRGEVTQYAKARGVSQTPHVGSDYDPAMVLSVSKSCGGVRGISLGRLVVETNLADTSVWVDGARIGESAPGKPLKVPGLADGPHTVCGRKAGYAEQCQEVLAAPNRETGVIIRLRYMQSPKASAREWVERGERLLYTSRSTVNPLNVAPLRRQQSTGDLKRARAAFERARKEDPTYGQAVYDLGRVNQLLGEEKASTAAFREAIQLDPENPGARAEYAGVLIEQGDVDEAFRNLIEGLRFEPDHAMARTMLARVYLDKDALPQCLEAADAALRSNPSSEMAHLWRADCLRKMAANGGEITRFVEAASSYRAFLGATDYSTPLYQLLAYHFIGFHLGGRVHADREEAFLSLRKNGYLGLCICERATGHPLLARDACERAIRLDPKNPKAHFAMGRVQLDLFNRDFACADAKAARKSFLTMLACNSAIEEAKHARHYLEELEVRLRLRCPS